jgi:hypothetical protein
LRRLLHKQLYSAEEDADQKPAHCTVDADPLQIFAHLFLEHLDQLRIVQLIDVIAHERADLAVVRFHTVGSLITKRE